MTNPSVTVKLVHYAYGPLGEIEDRAQDSTKPFKPKGLWLSVEDGYGWREWCEAEEFSGSWDHIYEITLAPGANVLHLKDPTDIDFFTKEWLSEPMNVLGLVMPGYPDWVRIAEQYDGIMIAPYQWGCKFGHDCFWYYSWDCSSACIWNESAIADVTLT